MDSQDVTVRRLTDIAVFLAGCWVVAAVLSSPLLGVHWFSPGDLSYSGAMYYHGIMVPVLLLLYLLTQKMPPLKVVNERAYAAGAILAVFFVGLGSIFNTTEGVSVAAVAQMIGMAMTDCLGIILVIAMAVFALKKDGGPRKTGAAFWLLFCSIIAILIAAPFGHFAGWCLDVGIKSVPGSSALLAAVDKTADEFQDGLVASHSHLVVVALLCGSAAATAIYFQYRSYVGWRRRVGVLGLRVTLVSLLSATTVYAVSALAGWEPPALFTSGPSGVPLDDLALTTAEVGILLLMVGLSGPLGSAGAKAGSPIKSNIRISIFCNWVFGFAGAVIPGIYIELNEGFYGAGVRPTPGALNDNIFMRGHLLYPFLLLPTILVVTLAVGWKYNSATVLSPWPRVFIWISVLGMFSGLAGEILWFTTTRDQVFTAAAFVMGVALIAGMISLWPGVEKP